MTNNGTHSTPQDEDGRVELTVRIAPDLHDAMKHFFADGDVFCSYDDLIATFLQAATCRPGAPVGRKSFLDLLVFAAWQPGEDFETTLFGRPGNEHDRRQLYSLMLGFDRLNFVNIYEQQEFRDRGPAEFARHMATRLARDLDRDDAMRIIETMTLGSPALHAEMLHWLDVTHAERKQD